MRNHKPKSYLRVLTLQCLAPDSGCPNGPAVLGTATFTSRDAYEAGQGSQPNITFQLLNVCKSSFRQPLAPTQRLTQPLPGHNCDVVTLRWRGPLPNPNIASGPSTQTPVVGLIVLQTKFNGYANAEPFLIQTVYSEFNSGSWLYDLGVFQPNCTSGGVTNTSSAANATKRDEHVLPGGAHRIDPKFFGGSSE